MKHPRKLKNYLLRPQVQLRVGFYFIVISIIFAFIIGWVFTSQFGNIYETILDLTDVREEVIDIVDQHIREAMFWLIVICVGFVCINITLAVWYTHRMVGPAVAFKRHIDEIIAGNYDAKTTLRRGDAFHDVALRLNTLSDNLSGKLPEHEHEHDPAQSEEESA